MEPRISLITRIQGKEEEKEKVFLTDSHGWTQRGVAATKKEEGIRRLRRFSQRDEAATKLAE